MEITQQVNPLFPMQGRSGAGFEMSFLQVLIFKTFKKSIPEHYLQIYTGKVSEGIIYHIILYLVEK